MSTNVTEPSNSNVSATPTTSSDSTKQEMTSMVKVSTRGKLIIDRVDIPLPTHEEEIQKAVKNAVRYSWIVNYSNIISVYTQFKPIIQQGPNCGIVALSMASQLGESTVSVEDILDAAKEKGFTNEGEMFDAAHLCSLANLLLCGMEANVQNNLLSRRNNLIETILEGNIILVPYDSDHSYIPGFFGGEKAHWALVCGCIIQYSDRFSFIDASDLKPDQDMPNLWHHYPGITSSLPQDTQSSWKQNFLHSDWQKNKDLDILLLWRQGKSRNLILSPLNALQRSNKQLFYYPNDGNYVINSIKDGLCNKTVVLHKINKETKLD